ncbi:hypothetical protein JOF53_000243 [Crossiella equi]|uniref:DUF4232 domain-containing protein n=1 Tax=Crossiella equi TaxID=130796 RepID=A0ABS5A4A5_9PSEU|nr:DUF4232 domain-containing protein [Crossiella equi]MBP2471371.1 hypothetical protein [Crossiella equi]
MPATTRLAALFCATALLTACGRPTPASAPLPPLPSLPTPPSTTTAAPVCPAEGVLITAEEVEGALGLRALGIVLTNCGTRDYTANGFPRIRVLDENRKPLTITVSNGSAPVSAPDVYDAPPRPVRLRPGDRTTARVLWRNTVTDSTVSPTNGHSLEVAPAAGQPAQIVPVRGGIDLGNTGRLAVNCWADRP